MSAPETERLTAVFTQDKVTKRTFRYKEDSETPIIGSIYVQQDEAARLGNPERITVTVEALNGPVGS